MGYHIDYQWDVQRSELHVCFGSKVLCSFHFSCLLSSFFSLFSSNQSILDEYDNLRGSAYSISECYVVNLIIAFGTFLDLVAFSYKRQLFRVKTRNLNQAVMPTNRNSHNLFSEFVMVHRQNVFIYLYLFILYVILLLSFLGGDTMWWISMKSKCSNTMFLNFFSNRNRKSGQYYIVEYIFFNMSACLPITFPMIFLQIG